MKTHEAGTKLCEIYTFPTGLLPDGTSREEENNYQLLHLYSYMQVLWRLGCTANVLLEHKAIGLIDPLWVYPAIDYISETL